MTPTEIEKLHEQRRQEFWRNSDPASGLSDPSLPREDEPHAPTHGLPMIFLARQRNRQAPDDNAPPEGIRSAVDAPDCRRQVIKSRKTINTTNKRESAIPSIIPIRAEAALAISTPSLGPLTPH
jgi:hypothetical protein